MALLLMGIILNYIFCYYCYYLRFIIPQFLKESSVVNLKLISDHKTPVKKLFSQSEKETAVLGDILVFHQ